MSITLSARVLLLVSVILLALGVTLPIMVVQPRMGPYHEYLSYFLSELDTPRTFSIMRGIVHLFHDGQILLAGVIVVFSVLFPLWKITCIWIGLHRLTLGECPGKMFYLAEKSGKYSMVDVFVVALLIVAIKGLPGGSCISLQPGLYCFLGSVFGALVASYLIDRQIQKHDEGSEMKDLEQQRHRKFMHAALSTAENCTNIEWYGVGCIIVNAVGQVLATGYTGEISDAGKMRHAEEVAIHKAQEAGADLAAIGTVLYSTLEPCSVRASGKTPCCSRIIAVGIPEVVYGAKEPYDEKLGIVCEGDSVLKAAGIRVTYLEAMQEVCLQSAISKRV